MTVYEKVMSFSNESDVKKVLLEYAHGFIAVTIFVCIAYRFNILKMGDWNHHGSIVHLPFRPPYFSTV